MKKKLAIIIPVSVVAVAVVAVIVTAVIYALPFLKISQSIKKDDETGVYTTEEAGSLADETVTDEQGSVITLPADESNSASQNTGTTSGKDKNTTSSSDKTTNGVTQKPSQSGTTEKTSGQQTSTTSQSAKPNTTSPVKPSTTNPPAKTTQNASEPTVPVTQPTTSPAQNTKSEYDIYRSGHFYAKGVATDGDGMVTPLELAVTDNTVFMISQIDGVNIGILVAGKKSYMIYEDKKKYCELSSVLMNAADLNPDEMIATARESYAELQPLEKAVRLAEGYVNGMNCKTYHFRNDEHELTTVSISGNKLVQVSKYDSNGRLSTTIDFTSVSADIPQSKTEPPKDYKKTGMISFLMELSNAMGVDLNE